MIGRIGIDYKNTPIDIREQFALTDSEAVRLVAIWIDIELIDGAIALSTCNRMEIYFTTPDDDESVFSCIINSIITNKNINPEYASYFTFSKDKETVNHLFRLASGMESMVLGETQILGQLKDAFRLATTNSQSSPLLSRFFHKAFEAAKRVRTTCIVKGASLSAGASAVDYIMQQKDKYQSSHTLIIGAGQMAETVYRRLKDYETGNISIYNRTKDRAERFASTHDNIKYYAENQLTEALCHHNIIYVATAALNPIITSGMLEDRQQNIILFDLGLPRNVETNVDELPIATVYTIDHLNDSSDDDIVMNIEKAQAIVDEVKEDFLQWVDASKIRSVIGIVQQSADALLSKELSKLPNTLSNEERTLIQDYDKHFRITYATAIVAALREITNDGKNTRYTEAISKLFDKVLKNNPYNE